jgi:hypothetical protein
MREITWREISWSEYATKDDAARVIAFYQRDAELGTLTTDGDETSLRLRSGVRISIFRLPTKQPFPKCSNSAAPTAAEQTLVVIHKQTVSK